MDDERPPTLRELILLIESLDLDDDAIVSVGIGHHYARVKGVKLPILNSHSVTIYAGTSPEIDGEWDTELEAMRTALAIIANGSETGDPVALARDVLAGDWRPPTRPDTPYREFFRAVENMRRVAIDLLRRQAEVIDYNERGAVSIQAEETVKALNLLAGLMSLIDLGEHR